MNQALHSASRTAVYELYNKGYTNKEIERRTGYEKEYIDNLVITWRCLEARDKQKQDEERYSKFSTNNIIIPKRNEGVSDFVLMTNNPEVEEAYIRLVNPLKVKPIP